MSAESFDLDATLATLAEARTGEKITATAEENIRAWLTEPRYAAYADEVADHVLGGKWQTLDDAFWTIIPFGTGGRRGKMYPIGSNTINHRTIGESAQGLADYVKANQKGPFSCGIAFDTRHRSVEFAHLCAGIMVAAGFKVYLLEEIRSTPQLSFLVRYKSCSCGIMVTASHNPPSDNAVKVYWSTGGQILPPHDQGVIDCVMNVDHIEVADFDESLRDGKIECCKDEVDAAFMEALAQQSFVGPRDVNIIYSPLHGVGAMAALPALQQDGFEKVELFAPHANPDGDFPNVPDNVANPESAAAFDTMIARGKEIGADIAMATDPDCDRLGCAAPFTLDSSDQWATLNGNQIGVLLGDFVFSQRQKAGTLSPEHYMVTTLVTSPMICRIAESFGIKVYHNNLVGFKWIGGVIDEAGPDKFVYACEESHGYLVGQYARDKDGAVATMLMAELAADCRAAGQTLHSRIDELYLKHGYHAERLATQRMEGSEGMVLMQKLMEKFRTDPPASLAGIDVVAVRDYQSNIVTQNAISEPLEGPTGNLVIMDLAVEGNYVAARPSGTEPKVKFYMFTYLPTDQIRSLDDAKRDMSERLSAFQSDLEEFAASVT